MKDRREFNKKLLVEGKDDQHVIIALCKKFDLLENFDIINCQGIDEVFIQIPVRLKESEIRTIGIIIDADTDIKKRWNSISTILNAAGYTLPINIPSNGLIINDVNKSKIGIWIMPNNNLNGMLEDFISFLIPADDKLLPIVNTTLQNIEEQNLNKYSINHKSKALIHTWLAWQEDPGTPLGQSITKKYLSTDKETCLKLINWLTELFND